MGEGDKPSAAKESAAQKPVPRQPVPHKRVAARPAASPRPAGTQQLPAQKQAITQMPAVLRAASAQDPSDVPYLSRTATLDDPLTTSLLAEVARRSRTIEVSQEQIDEAMEMASDIDPVDRDPDDSI